MRTLKATEVGTLQAPAQNFAEVLGEATLAFLQHGTLSRMAQILIRGTCQSLGAGGVLCALDSANRLRPLARFPVDFAPPGLSVILTQVDSPWMHPAATRHTCLLTESLPAGIDSFLGVPCLTQGELTAVIGLVNRPGGFTPADVAQAEIYAKTIALALHSARLQLTHQQTLADLRQAQKMEALGHLAAGIAHDFNNMLTVISGYGSLLARELPPGSSAREDIDTILDASRRAADLSRQLLAFSRRQILRPKVLDLNIQIHKLSKLLRRIVCENIAIDLELERQLPLIKADPGQIEQILMNLIVNACDALPHGGRISIRSGQRRFAPEFLASHKGSLPGDYSWFAVHDDGEGIAPKLLEKIFQPFFTTKALGKGTGLGLATVYGIVKQSQGYITVASTPGEGTCFTVYFPQTREPLGSPPKPIGKSCRAQRNLQLLVVEDDADVLTYATRVLEQQGFEVIALRDPGPVDDLLRQHEHQIDLLITDMVMPTLSGPLLARRLRTSFPDLPVLYLSGYGQVTFRSDFTCGEPGRFLAKPFTPEQLIEAIGECLPDTLMRPAGDG